MLHSVKVFLLLLFCFLPLTHPGSQTLLGREAQRYKPDIIFAPVDDDDDDDDGEMGEVEDGDYEEDPFDEEGKKANDSQSLGRRRRRGIDPFKVWRFDGEGERERERRRPCGHGRTRFGGVSFRTNQRRRDKRWSTLHKHLCSIRAYTSISQIFFLDKRTVLFYDLEGTKSVL